MQGNPIPTPQSIGAQPANAGLQAIASLPPTSGNFIVGNGSTWIVQPPANTRTTLGGTTVGQSFFTLSNPNLTSFPLISATNTVSARTASQYRSDLGLVIGTNVQAHDADLAAFADLTTTGLVERTGNGSAATRTIGTESGNVPVVGAGNKLAEAIIPGAGIIRGWVYCEIIAGAPSIAASSGVTSVTKVADGIFEVNLSSSAPGSGKFASFASSQAPEFWDAATGTAWSTSSKFTVVYARAGVGFLNPFAFSAFAIW